MFFPQRILSPRDPPEAPGLKTGRLFSGTTMASWEITYLVIVVLDFTLKNGVKVNGFRMTSHINEMDMKWKNKSHSCLKPPTSYFLGS